jgi:hypothetical protein
MTSMTGSYSAKGIGDNPRDVYALTLEPDGSFRFAYVYHEVNGTGSVRMSGSYSETDTEVILTPTEMTADFSDHTKHGAGHRSSWDYTGEPIPLTIKNDSLIVPVLSKYYYEFRIPKSVEVLPRVIE